MMSLSDALSEIGEAIHKIAMMIPPDMAEHFETLMLATALLAQTSRLRLYETGRHLDRRTLATRQIWSKSVPSEVAGV